MKMNLKETAGWGGVCAMSRTEIDTAAPLQTLNIIHLDEITHVSVSE